MRKKCLILAAAVVMLTQSGAGRAEAFIFINEFLADPASGLAGDANHDGTRHSYHDEFIELFNSSSEMIDISSWSIEDASSERHVFGINTWVQAGGTFVVFGGGLPSLAGIDWMTASSGSLNLNNGGDTITLYDVEGQIIDSYTYGSEAGDNQSVTRSPEGSQGEWIKHSDLPGADGRLFSPGYFVNTVDEPSQNAVPEPLTILSLALGAGAMGLHQKIRGFNRV